MNNTDKKLNIQITSRSNDPDFWNWVWQAIPNPDPIIQKLGITRNQAYKDIFYDSHVIAQIQSIRSGLLSYEWRVKPGSNKRVEKKAAQLCEEIIKSVISPYSWEQIAWQILEAIFYGSRVHEIVYESDGQYLVPVKIIDVPERLLFYGANEIDPEIRIRTFQNPIEGEPMPPYKFLTTIHMPSRENIHGVAIFSACYWPYFFKKTAGMRGLARYCERHGAPWIIGKYPPGLSESEQRILHTALEDMSDSGVATMPGENMIEIIESKSTNLPQAKLVDICNAELSKALSCVTLTTELDGQGSRAAAEVHHGREKDVHKTDRGIVCTTFNTLYRYVTELNFGKEVMPPVHEFYEETGIRGEWVKNLDIARRYYPIPRKFAGERLQFPVDDESDDILPGYEGNMLQELPVGEAVSQQQFASGSADSENTQLRRLSQKAASEFKSDFPGEIENMIRNASSYEEMQEQLPNLFKKKVT